jgi:hypothetical protein
MNEQAVKLYEQAVEFAYDTIGIEHANTAYFQGVIAGKFAELIVGECVSIAHPQLKDVGEWAAGMRLAQKRIKEHFGVKE